MSHTTMHIKHIRGEISKQEYLSSTLAAMDIHKLCKGSEGLEECIKGAISESYWYLDRLDRSDCFWKPGNGLPTIHKLLEYSALMLNKSPSEFWAWSRIALLYIHCADFLEYELWKYTKNNETKISFLIPMAWNYGYYSGMEATYNLVDLVQRLEIPQETTLRSLRILTAKIPSSKTWSQSLQDIFLNKK